MKRLIYILIAVNLCIILFFAFVVNNHKTDNPEVLYVSYKNAEDIKKIEVSSKDERYTFIYDSKWFLMDDESVILNQNKVEELAYQTAVISALEVIETKAKALKKYEAFEERIKVTYDDNREAEYIFGNKILNTNRYFMYSVNDSTVYGVTAGKRSALFKGLEFYKY